MLCTRCVFRLLCYYISLSVSLSLRYFDMVLISIFTPPTTKRNKTKDKTMKNKSFEIHIFLWTFHIQLLSKQAMVDWISWWCTYYFCRLLFVCWLCQRCQRCSSGDGGGLVHLLLDWPLSMSDNKRRHTNSIEYLLLSILQLHSMPLFSLLLASTARCKLFKFILIQ